MMQIFKDAIGKLSYPIDPNHKRDCFIKDIFPLTCKTLTQQNLDTLQDILEQDTLIEAMEVYSHEH